MAPVELPPMAGWLDVWGNDMQHATARAVIGLVLLTASSITASAAESIDGHWAGRYGCRGKQDVPMTITLSSAAGASTGIFSFEGNAPGSFHLTATIGADGSVLLAPGKWIERPAGYRTITLKGQLSQAGDAISGTFPECRQGTFAAKRIRAEAATPEADEAIIRDAPPEPAQLKWLAVPSSLSSHTEWATRILLDAEALIAAGDDSFKSWSPLRLAVVFGRGTDAGVDARRELSGELDRAHGLIAAFPLITAIEAIPTDSADGLETLLSTLFKTRLGMNRQAAASVIEAARPKVDTLLRPHLQAVADAASVAPATLDGLLNLRAAGDPVTSRLDTLRFYFGSADPDGVLAPYWTRLAEIEESPELAEDLRQELAALRTGSDPRGATDSLLRIVLRPQRDLPELLAIAEHARDRADFAAITTVDLSGEASDAGTPSIQHMATVAHGRVLEGNAALKAFMAQCRAGYSDPVTGLRCAPMLALDQIGGVRARVARIEKHGCEPVVAGESYRCRFLQDIEIAPVAGGPMAPDLVDMLFGLVIPGGYPGDVVEALFVRSAPDGEDTWLVAWPKSR